MHGGMTGVEGDPTHFVCVGMVCLGDNMDSNWINVKQIRSGGFDGIGVWRDKGGLENNNGNLRFLT